MPDGKDMTLKIMACRQIYSGKNQRGDEYTIYEVDAQNAQGQKIDQKLRTFSALPIGQMVEVTVTPFDSERHGKSYTLYEKDRPRGNTQEQVNNVSDRIKALEDRVTALEGRPSGQAAPAPAPASASTPPSQRPAGGPAGEAAQW